MKRIVFIRKLCVPVAVKGYSCILENLINEIELVKTAVTIATDTIMATTVKMLLFLCVLM